MGNVEGRSGTIRSTRWLQRLCRAQYVGMPRFSRLMQMAVTRNATLRPRRDVSLFVLAAVPVAQSFGSRTNAADDADDGPRFGFHRAGKHAARVGGGLKRRG